MPTYVYECSKCAVIREIEQRITDEPLTDCECGGKGTLRRLIQPPAVMFKGSGFYVNDTCCQSTSADTGAAPPCESGG